jgi:hypothetical protein
MTDGGGRKTGKGKLDKQLKPIVDGTKIKPAKFWPAPVSRPPARHAAHRPSSKADPTLPDGSRTWLKHWRTLGPTHSALPRNAPNAPWGFLQGNLEFDKRAAREAVEAMSLGRVHNAASHVKYFFLFSGFNGIKADGPCRMQVGRTLGSHFLDLPDIKTRSDDGGSPEVKRKKG